MNNSVLENNNIPKLNSLTAKRGDKNIYLFPHSIRQL